MSDKTPMIEYVPGTGSKVATSDPAVLFDLLDDVAGDRTVTIDYEVVSGEPVYKVRFYDVPIGQHLDDASLAEYGTGPTLADALRLALAAFYGSSSVQDSVDHYGQPVALRSDVDDVPLSYRLDGRLLVEARGLLSPGEGHGGEYERALVEVICRVSGLTTDDHRESVERLLRAGATG